MAISNWPGTAAGTYSALDTRQSSILTPGQTRQYHEQGYLILRALFSQAEMAAIQEECSCLLVNYADRIDPCNLRCRFMPHHENGQLLFEVFDPVNDLSDLLRTICFDPRLLGCLETIYGEPAELFKEKLIFKMPGAKGYELHQDIPQYWPGWPRSFLTVLLAVDESNRANGCTEVYRDYHHHFLSSDPKQYMLPADCVCASRREYLELQPGDVAIFHGLTPHGSASNRTQGTRRAFYMSYNARSDGGDQRLAHYAAFREMLSKHLPLEAQATHYFR